MAGTAEIRGRCEGHRWWRACNADGGRLGRVATAAGRAVLAALAGAVAAAVFAPTVAYPAGLLGVLFGAGYFGIVVDWSARFGAVAVVSLVASQAVFHALALALTPPRRAAPGRWVAGAAAAWVLAEFVRALPLGGFEWAQLGQLAADLPMRTAAGVVGSLGVSGLVVALAAGLVSPPSGGRCAGG